MKIFVFRLIKAIFGLLLFAFGIVATIRADIGYAPWDVFHFGLSNITGLTFGLVSILVGVVLVVIVSLLGEKIGLGTILNGVLVGVFIDIILRLDFIPLAVNFAVGVLMLIAGLFVVSFGTYFYMSSAYGSGPRDSLMIVLTRKTKLPVGACRGFVEAAVVIAGWLLGGKVGIGTIISAGAVGLCVQITFKICKFDATAIKHETLGQTFSALTKKTK